MWLWERYIDAQENIFTLKQLTVKFRTKRPKYLEKAFNKIPLKEEESLYERRVNSLIIKNQHKISYIRKENIRII